MLTINPINTMNATARNGDVWTGEKEKEGATTWWIYQDGAGRLYQSKEVPAYRIHMDNARIAWDERGNRFIAPNN